MQNTKPLKLTLQGFLQKVEIMIDGTINRAVKPELSMAKHFLTLLDDVQEKFVFEIIEEPKPLSSSPHIQRYFGSFEEHQEKLKKANLEGYGVFVAINATDGKGRKKENVTKVRALFVDLDGSPLQPILDCNLEPHIIIESSPSRFHAYWFIENVPLEKFESIQKSLAKQFSGDSSVCDLPRLMRLPGFLHRKGELFRSHIIKTFNALPYSYDKFQNSFNLRSENKEDAPLEIPEPNFSQPDNQTLHKLKKLDLLKNLEEEGRWRIRCPWSEEHSQGEDSYYYSKPNKKYTGEGFNCFHAHCKHRDIRALRFFLGLTPVEGIDSLPLFREIPPAKEFPVEALGPILGKAAQEIHRSLKAPLAIICQSLLAAASLITQAHANVEIDGRVIALSLFFISVAESGERKSAIDDIALSSILKWQSQLWSVYREERKIYEAKLEQWNSSKKDKSTQKTLEEKPEPEAPIMPIIIIEEPTYEGLVKYLEFGQPSVGLFSEEGGRFVGGNAMNRDNMLKTLAGLSSLWDAKKDKPISRMRSGEGSLALYGRRMALHLMVQESVYSLINQHSMCESQGFLPRCLISYPESTVGSRPYVKVNALDLPEVKAYLQRCNALLDRTFPLAPKPAPKNQLEPPSINLSPEAYVCWIDFHDKFENTLGKGEAYHSIRRFGSKAAEHVLRVAGVLSVFEKPLATQIEKNYTERAIEIIHYYLYERTRLESYSSIDSSLMTAQRVLDWASSKGKQAILLRDLYQYGPSEVRSKDKALAILKILEEHGKAFPIPANEVFKGSSGKAWRFV